jgi:hypothetical protein
MNEQIKTTISTILSGWLRHFISLAAGAIATYGFVIPDSEQTKIVTTLTSAIFFALSLIASWVNKKLQTQQLNVALATVPGTDAVKTFVAQANAGVK